jgi:hypothetical protein
MEIVCAWHAGIKAECCSDSWPAFRSQHSNVGMYRILKLNVQITRNGLRQTRAMHGHAKEHHMKCGVLYVPCGFMHLKYTLTSPYIYSDLCSLTSEHAINLVRLNLRINPRAGASNYQQSSLLHEPSQPWCSPDSVTHALINLIAGPNINQFTELILGCDS